MVGPNHYQKYRWIPNFAFFQRFVLNECFTTKFMRPGGGNSGNATSLKNKEWINPGPIRAQLPLPHGGLEPHRPATWAEPAPSILTIGTCVSENAWNPGRKSSKLGPRHRWDKKLTNAGERAKGENRTELSSVPTISCPSISNK